MKPLTYDTLTKVLHWSMAIIIIYASIAGYVMHLLTPSTPAFTFLSVLNMSLATIATPLLAIRYLWTFFRKSPESLKSISTVQMNIAKLVHSLLYLLMFIVFSSGYLMLTESYSLFWLVDVNNLISNPDINEFFFNMHRAACMALFLSVVLHVLAVVKHQFIARNNVLGLMV